jgi:hypothetical protein
LVNLLGLKIYYGIITETDDETEEEDPARESEEEDKIEWEDDLREMSDDSSDDNDASIIGEGEVSVEIVDEIGDNNREGARALGESFEHRITGGRLSCFAGDFRFESLIRKGVLPWTMKDHHNSSKKSPGF